MDPAEIIRACMERGILVSSEDLKLMEAGLSVEEFMASKTQAPQVPPQEEKAGKITYRLRKSKIAETVTPAEILEQRKSNHETIKGLLLSKTSAVSISNAGEGQSVSLIGMVKRVGDGTFLLEDVTGEIEVSCPSGCNVSPGDVVCARGTVRGGRMLCSDVLYPDVPLLRSVGRIEATMLLVPGKGKPAAPADIILSTEAIDTDSKNIVFSSSPTHLCVYRDGKVNVTFYRSDDEISRQDAIGMLKKRLLRKTKALVADEESFLIEPVPDILWIASHGGEWIETYKGVTIVHTPEDSVRQAVIDLKTREARLI